MEEFNRTQARTTTFKLVPVLGLEFDKRTPLILELGYLAACIKILQNARVEISRSVSDILTLAFLFLPKNTYSVLILNN